MAIRPRESDGRITRAEAAELAGVEACTITAWIKRGHLKNVKHEGRRVWLWPPEVIETEWRLAPRARRQRWDRELAAAVAA